MRGRIKAHNLSFISQKQGYIPQAGYGSQLIIRAIGYFYAVTAMKKRWRTYGLILLASMLLAALLCHFKGDEWENRIRFTFYRISGDSIPAYSKVLTDSNGVPYVAYAPLNGVAPGIQHNSTIVGNYAVDYYNSYNKTKDTATLLKFRHCVNSLIDSITKKDGHALYVFYWQQPWYDSVKAPFKCGMTSGRAIEAFTYAFGVFHDSAYLNAAHSLLSGYFLPIQKGGFTYQDDSGWWYEELADSNAHTPHILDGHIYAVTGVQKFWLLTKNDSAKIIVDRGLAGLKSALPRYDAGDGAVYYDNYKKLADQSYHELLAAQMKQLWESTGDSVFLNYHKKWIAPLEAPYLVRVVKLRNRSGYLLYLLCTASIAILLTIGLRLFSRKKP